MLNTKRRKLFGIIGILFSSFMNMEDKSRLEVNDAFTRLNYLRGHSPFSIHEYYIYMTAIGNAHYININNLTYTNNGLMYMYIYKYNEVKKQLLRIEKIK